MAFERVSGVTPRQSLRRTRWRATALRRRDDHWQIVDMAFDCGFNDLSTFNHAFRAECSASPRVWRTRGTARGS